MLGSCFEDKFVRVAPDGERFVAHCFSDGRFRVADPVHGGEKHHARNQIPIDGSDIEAYLARGFSLRMRGEVSGRVNLIAPANICVTR